MLCHQPKSLEKNPSLEDAQIESTPEPENINDPNFWKTRIILSAFECWFEEFELSAPSLSYVRKWKPACKRCGKNSARREKGKGTRSRRNRTSKEKSSGKKGKTRRGKKYT
jgi:hypothetical protein